jgi:hypothetical protein
VSDQGSLKSLAFSQDGDWLFAPDTHDRGVRILHLASGKTYQVLRGDAPFYKTMSISIPASLVALLRPGDPRGRGPYGLEVWRLAYRPRQRPVTTSAAARGAR